MDADREKMLEFMDVLDQNSRSYAGHFCWLTDRTIEELDVANIFCESLRKDGKEYFHCVKARGLGKDPPDCEAMLCDGGIVGIEVTELVDGDLIAKSKRGEPFFLDPWTIKRLHYEIDLIISRKDSPRHLKGGPYSQYILIIYCDDPVVLDFRLTESLRSALFASTNLLDRVYFLMSPMPSKECYPYIELKIRRV